MEATIEITDLEDGQVGVNMYYYPARRDDSIAQQHARLMMDLYKDYLVNNEDYTLKKSLMEVENNGL
jgi:hypothetical protein